MTTVAQCPDGSSCPGVPHDWQPEPAVIHGKKRCLPRVAKPDAEARLQGILELCNTWDGYTKGESPTTRQIRDIALGRERTS